MKFFVIWEKCSFKFEFHYRKKAIFQMYYVTISKMFCTIKQK